METRRLESIISKESGKRIIYLEWISTEPLKKDKLEIFANNNREHFTSGPH